MIIKLIQEINGYSISDLNCVIAGGVDSKKTREALDFKNNKKYQSMKALSAKHSENATRKQIYSRRNKLGNIVYPER